LKRANAMFSIEEIESILDDTADAIAKQKEIDELISGQLTQVFLQYFFSNYFGANTNII
jgi:hypothetical protein